jgi:hypothetical protein
MAHIFCKGQKIATQIIFEAQINNQKAELRKKSSLASIADSVELTKLKFYIGNVVFWANNKQVAVLPQQYYLIDFENQVATNIKFEAPQFDSISFTIGIDSNTNEKGVQGGSLDPVHNMYWAWQSGYVNFKIEGKIGSKYLMSHIGGFLPPYNCIQYWGSKVISTNNVFIKMNLEVVLKKMYENNNIMSPSGKAVEFAKLIKQNIVLQ